MVSRLLPLSKFHCPDAATPFCEISLSSANLKRDRVSYLFCIFLLAENTSLFRTRRSVTTAFVRFLSNMQINPSYEIDVGLFSIENILVARY